MCCLPRAALIVKGNNPLRRSRHVGDDEADSWIKFARMPLDLGDYASTLAPALGLIAEADGAPNSAFGFGL